LFVLHIDQRIDKQYCALVYIEIWNLRYHKNITLCLEKEIMNQSIQNFWTNSNEKIIANEAKYRKIFVTTETALDRDSEISDLQ